MKKILNSKIFMLILGMFIVLGINAVADTTLIAGSKISYSNTTSGLSATDMQSAMDELYQKAKHTETYTYPANSTGATTDLDEFHHYRYVNAENVYNKGNADGVSATKVGTAGQAQVLSGYTFTNSSSVGTSGTMTNRGAVSKSLNCGESYTVPTGYHNGSGTVTANSLASQTRVDSGKTAVGAGQMLTGYQGWVNGSKITGTMANNGRFDWAPAGRDYTTLSAGYYSGGTLDCRTAYDNGKASGGTIYQRASMNCSTDCSTATGKSITMPITGRLTGTLEFRLSNGGSTIYGSAAIRIKKNGTIIWSRGDGDSNHTEGTYSMNFDVNAGDVIEITNSIDDTEGWGRWVQVNNMTLTPTSTYVAW